MGADAHLGADRYSVWVPGPPKYEVIVVFLFSLLSLQLYIYQTVSHLSNTLEGVVSFGHFCHYFFPVITGNSFFLNYV